MAQRPPGLDRIVADLQRMTRLTNARIISLAVTLGLVKIYSDVITYTITAASVATGTYNFPAGTFTSTPVVVFTVSGGGSGLIRATPLLTAVSASSFNWRIDLNAVATVSGGLQFIAVATQ